MKEKFKVIAAMIALLILVPVAAYSYNPYQFEFQEVQGITFEILSHEEFRAQFGDNPDIPLSDEAIISLAERLFIPHWEMTPETYVGEQEDREYEVGLLFASLQNPDIPHSTRYQVDKIISASIPPLPKTYTSGHFKFYYTDNDPNPDHNVTLSEVQATAVRLNSYWDTYATNFKTPKHYVSGSAQMIDVKVYYLGAGLYGETSSSWNYINLNSKLTVKDACKRRTTSAHELFHRVQYAYGYVSGTANLKWIVEGTASWSQKYTNATIGDYMSRMVSGLSNPDLDLIISRSYDAAHFWVYLQRRTSWSAIRDVWATYETNGKDAKAAVNTVVNSRLGLTFDKYSWLWARANYIKDLGNASLYDYYEDETTTTSCGITYGPLSHVPRTTTTISNTTKWGKTGSVKPYGADYYTFNINSNVTKIEIKIDGEDAGNFAYYFVPIKDNSYVAVTGTTNTDYTYSRTITAGQWDKVAVVIVGGSTGGTYTISVNACIAGKWVDGYGYVWTLGQTGATLSGKVDTTTCGVWNVTGSYNDPNISLTATNPPPIEDGCCTSFTYTGTVSACSSASGTWTNACGGSGTWSMTKNDASIESGSILFDGPTPCSSK